MFSNFFCACDSTLQKHPQRPHIAMASVYKTLSGNDNHEKEPTEKRNKQRVLILVLSLQISAAPVLMIDDRVREVSHSDIAICCRTSTRLCECYSDSWPVFY